MRSIDNNPTRAKLCRPRTLYPAFYLLICLYRLLRGRIEPLDKLRLSIGTSLPDFLVGASILVPSAKRPPLVVVSIPQCDFPSFGYGVGKLGNHFNISGRRITVSYDLTYTNKSCRQLAAMILTFKRQVVSALKCGVFSGFG